MVFWELGGSCWSLCQTFTREVTVGKQPSVGQEQKCLPAPHSKEGQKVGVYPVASRSSCRLRKQRGHWQKGPFPSSHLPRPS